jgi:hypothetical protein
LDQEAISRSIIGAIGQLDAYQLPDAKGYSSMIRYLTGVTDEFRQQRRDEVLATTAKDFRAWADLLERLTEAGVVVVMGSTEDIETANARRSQPLAVQSVL